MSRKLYLAEECTLRFPDRNDDFDDGVEVGILAAQMDMGVAHIPRWVGTRNVQQIRSVAEKLGYRLTLGSKEGGATHISLWCGAARPRLAIVKES